VVEPYYYIYSIYIYVSIACPKNIQQQCKEKETKRVIYTVYMCMYIKYTCIPIYSSQLYIYIYIDVETYLYLYNREKEHQTNTQENTSKNYIYMYKCLSLKWNRHEVGGGMSLLKVTAEKEEALS
jgi:hypothetical protein